jgi:hypothetical protein
VLLLGLSFAMAFAYAVVLVIVLNVTLPPTDGAYGSILILDPFVFTVMVPVGAIAGGLIYPFVLLVLRTRSWKKGISIISAMVLLA